MSENEEDYLENHLSSVEDNDEEDNNISEIEDNNNIIISELEYKSNEYNNIISRNIKEPNNNLYDYLTDKYTIAIDNIMRNKIMAIFNIERLEKMIELKDNGYSNGLCISLYYHHNDKVRLKLYIEPEIYNVDVVIFDKHNITNFTEDKVKITDVYKQKLLNLKNNLLQLKYWKRCIGFSYHSGDERCERMLDNENNDYCKYCDKRTLYEPEFTCMICQSSDKGFWVQYTCCGTLLHSICLYLYKQNSKYYKVQSLCPICKRVSYTNKL
jgi:hypothetical protein